METKRLTRSLDVYRKIDSDLTRATSLGAFLSMVALTLMFVLFVLEINDYLTLELSTNIILDPGSEEEELQVNFNMTIERIPCPYISIELHNQLGTHQTNITRNVHRYKVKTKAYYSHTVNKMDSSEPKRVLLQEDNLDEQQRDVDIQPYELTTKNFEQYISEYDLVLVDFFAPWCFWSKKLEPLWTAAAHDFQIEFPKKRVGIAWVDCTHEDQIDLCHKNHIAAFPTIIAFKAGNSHSADIYHEDRTLDAIRQYIVLSLASLRQPASDISHGERVLKSIELADLLDGDGQYSPAVEGCRLEGSIKTPKVPGVLVFATQSSGQSIDGTKLNVSHIFHHLSFGQKLNKHLKSFLPQEVVKSMNPLDGRKFHSRLANLTHEHFIKIVGSTYNTEAFDQVRLYKYLHYSSPFHTSETSLPTIRVHFDITPMHVVIDVKKKPFYRFITNLFAIIGGTFTFFGLMDSFLDSATQILKKKTTLGKLS